MRRSPLALAVVALLAAGCGAADSAKDDDTATAASKPKAADLELTVSRGAFAELGLATELLGSLRGANRLAGVPVVIEADPWPFDGRFTSVRRVRTRSNGRFRLIVTARSNTTYRARAAGTRSPGTTVRVLPVPTYRLVLADPKTSRAVVRYALPHGAPATHVRVYLCTGTAHATQLRRAGSAALRRTGPHEAGAEIEYTYPRPDQKVRLRACTRSPISPAYDEDDADGECGAVGELPWSR